MKQVLPSSSLAYNFNHCTKHNKQEHEVEAEPYSVSQVGAAIAIVSPKINVRGAKVTITVEWVIPKLASEYA